MTCVLYMRESLRSKNAMNFISKLEKGIKKVATYKFDSSPEPKF